MKRFLLLIPYLLFLVIAGCISVPTTEDAVFNAGLTITAASQMPTFASTPNPSEMQIVETINQVLQGPRDKLAITIDASYIVHQATINQSNKNSTLTLEVRCECALNGTCCNLEHTFVEIINAMKSKNIDLIGLVPLNTDEFRVICYSHTEQLGAISVPWPQVMSYMIDSIDGYQFGGMVTKVPASKKP